MEYGLLDAIMARKNLTSMDLLGTRSSAARIKGSQAAGAIGEFIRSLPIGALKSSLDVQQEAAILGQAATDALTRITAERTANKEVKLVLDLHQTFGEDDDIFTMDTAGVLMVEGLKAGTQSPYNPFAIRSLKGIYSVFADTGTDVVAEPGNLMAALIDEMKRTQFRLKVSGSDDLIIPIGAFSYGTVTLNQATLAVAHNPLAFHHEVAPHEHAIQGLDLVAADDAISATLNDPIRVGAFGNVTEWGEGGSSFVLWGTLTILLQCEAL